MAATYNIWLTNALGNRIRPLVGISSLMWTKIRNNYGEFSLVTSDAFFNVQTEAKVDYRIEIERKPTDAPQRLEAVGFIRYRDVLYHGSLQRTIIAGPDQNHLLTRRIIDAAPASAEADKTGAADDIMKEYVDEWLGGGAAADDDITGIINFSIQPDATLGPAIDAAEARQILLAALQDVSDLARLEGTPTYFQIYPITATNWQFRTYIDYIGTDRTAGANRIVFAPELGNIINPEYVFDRREEFTVVVAGGTGTGDTRPTQEANDPVRLIESPLNRIVRWHDAYNAATAAAIMDAASAQVDVGRPEKLFRATILDTANNRYGVDWDFGDRLMASWAGEEFEVEVTAIAGALNEDGSEDIVAKVEAVLSS